MKCVGIRRAFRKIPVVEPTRSDRLRAESELFGFAISGRPLELFRDIAQGTYCPMNRLADLTGIIETELFSKTYPGYGLAT